jgi:uncharacterized protein
MHLLRYFLIFILAVLIGSAHAQDDCPAPAGVPSKTQLEELQKSAKDRGFLWRISKDGRSSYLYGTIHVSKLEWAFPGPQMIQAIRQTDSIALELNLLDPEAMRQLSQGMLDNPATPLPPKLQARVARQAKASCVPLAQITPLRPEFQAITLTVMALKKQGLDPTYGADMVLAGVASSSKKPLQAIESVDDQLSLMTLSSREEALAAVEEGLALLEDGTAQVLLAKLAQSWADSDYPTMSSYASWCNCLNTAKERADLKRLLGDRNPAMAARIDTLHGDGRRIFAAVGSLHMIGADGLPALMEKRGYTVQKIF